MSVLNGAMKLHAPQAAPRAAFRSQTPLPAPFRRHQARVQCSEGTQESAPSTQQQQRAVSSRRRLLSGAAAVAAAAAAGAARPPRAVSEEEESAADFYQRWPYQKPSDILPFVMQRAAAGDADAVLAAMDEWARRYPMYAIGAEKGRLLDGVLRELRPATALEIGTFLGYSAIRTARQLAPGGLLLCIEANPDNAATARQIIDYAGVGGRVVILGGLGSEKLPEAAQLLAERPAAGGGAAASGGSGGDSVLARLRRQAAERAAAPAADVSDGGGDEAAAAAAASQAAAAAAEAVAGSQVDYLFLDHCKPCYLPDLLAAERLGLVGAGTVVAADNVVYPGAPGYLEHLDAAGRYATVLLDAPHEVDKPWDPKWRMGEPDAVAVSLRW